MAYQGGGAGYNPQTGYPQGGAPQPNYGQAPPPSNVGWATGP
uniref:Uncharacterized protein n=1 Tax=Panagrolaimus sp. ES5 TaxID=591445 RepID=A0AC34GMV9_9BILA